MLGHDNVTDDDETVAQPSLFQHGKEAVAAARRAKKWETPIARTRDKVQVMRAIVAVQAPRGITSLAYQQHRSPPLQKAQGWGTHSFVMGKKKHQDRERLGHPPEALTTQSLPWNSGGKTFVKYVVGGEVLLGGVGCGIGLFVGSAPGCGVGAIATLGDPAGQLVVFASAGYEAGAAISEAGEKRDAAWQLYNSMCVN